MLSTPLFGLIAGDCEEIVFGPHPDARDANAYQPVPLGG
jgi:hypothetical protein